MADKKKKDKVAPAVTEDEDRDAPRSDEEGEGGTDELELETKKKGLKPILIIIGAVIFLIGAGAGVYYSGMLDGLLGKGGEEEVAEGEHAEGAAAEGGHEKKKEAKKGGHGEKGKEGEGGTGFMPLPDLVVNLSNTQGQPRYLKLKVQLELEDPADQPAVEAIAPRVIDHFQTYLRELRISDLRGSAGIYRLRQELLARVNDAADPVVVKDVLFQEILIQ